MRDIIFQEVGMENYGPYIDPMIHTFENDTITLLTGPNGIGKTMSLDAIPFTLFGSTSKGARGDDVVNNVVGKNCKTWVRFKINEDQYIATRYQKYTKRGNTVVLNKNGVDIKSGHREVLPEVERLICPAKSFMNTLMFGQKVKDFFTDLVDSDKKEIFRKILMLEQYVAFYKETDSRLKEVKNQIANLLSQIKINEGILQDNGDQIKMLTALQVKFYKDQKETVASLNKELESINRLSVNWQKELETLGKTKFNLSTLTDELAKINAELDNLDSKYYLMENDLNNQMGQKQRELQSAADEAEKKIRETTDASHSALASSAETIKTKSFEVTEKHRKELHQFDIQKSELVSENVGYDQRITEIKSNVLDKEFSSCPTCEQEVNDVTRRSLMTKIEGYQMSIDANDKKIALINEDMSACKAKYKELKQSMDKTLDSIQEQIKQLKQNEQDQYTEIQGRLGETYKKVNQIFKQKTAELEAQAKQEKAELLIRKSETSNLKDEAVDHQHRIDEINGTITDLKSRYSMVEGNIKTEKEKEYNSDQLMKYQQREHDLQYKITDDKSVSEKLQSRVNVLEFWKTGFSSSGIPSMLIDESIPFMNKQVAEYLDMLTNGRYIVSFDTLAETKGGEFRDKISVRVLDTYTQANSRVQLSGGQTRIVDIATILTLGELQANMQNMKINILLFDEIFDALDDENIGYVAKVLNKLKDGKSIYIISHQHQDQVEADQTLALS